MRQDRFCDHMILDPIGKIPLLALSDDDRVRAAFASFLIDRRKNIAARRNTARKLDRAEVADHRGGHPI
jgi:hypothetical protein